MLGAIKAGFAPFIISYFFAYLSHPDASNHHIFIFDKDKEKKNQTQIYCHSIIDMISTNNRFFRSWYFHQTRGEIIRINTRIIFKNKVLNMPNKSNE